MADFCPICRFNPEPCPGITAAQDTLGYEGWRAAVAYYSTWWPHDADHARAFVDEADVEWWMDIGGEA